MAAAAKVLVAARPLHASDSGACHYSLKHQSLPGRVTYSRMRIEGAVDCKDLRVRALDNVVGVLGGGQLGRMLCEAASTMGVKVAVLDPSKDCPASAVAHLHVVGSFRDTCAVEEFAKGCGVLTIEIEHVDVETLDALASQGVDVQPSPNSIRIIQDKYLQKLHFRTHGIPLPDLLVVNDMESLKQAANLFGYPLMIKSRRLAYDGHGNAVVKNQDELYSAVLSLGGFERGLYAEKWALFEKELAVMVARGRDGELRCYPVVETTHRNNICYTVEAPAGVPKGTQKAALEIAQRAIGSLEGAGVFGVELFLLADGQILLNEVAPRPHNSGHHTIEACYVSQFEQHLRAVLGLPLGDTTMKVSAAAMYNLLGENEGEAGMSVAHQTLERAFSIPGASVHWYDKREIRKQRKMGHITVVGPSMDVVRARMHQITRSSGQNESPVLEGSDHSIDHSVAPIVGIIMGSDSDLRVMKDSAQVLESFGVPYEMKIVSAHRTADRMCEYAKNAHVEGLKVIIAGAGGAAHLPGMVGAITPLPAIGVPVKATSLDGLDSLLSIVQMPRGVPVATVAIDDATNAGLIAVRMLASLDKHLQLKIISRQGEMERMEMLKRLETAGIHQTMNSGENGSPCVEESDQSGAPVVGIITSSDSDSRVMQDASEVLKSFGVRYERVLLSAEYVENAHTKGLKVLIVGTDGAADLPDTVAGVTPLLVIGVPRKVSSLNGLDSLVSVVQAAKGGPVAWVAIDNGTNAGILAVRFLESSDMRLLDRMISYQTQTERTVVENARRLEALGWKQYNTNL